MSRNQITGYFYPTQVVLVDDNRRYLDNLCLKLDDNFHYQLFEDPQASLEYINRPSQKLARKDGFISISDDTQFEPRSIQVNIPAIREEIYNPERFNCISVVVVDYAMPSMNGLELCEQIQDQTIKKIMLTGEADQSIAVEAFNDGIIDKFIMKSAPNYTEDLNSAIINLQQQYFKERSEIVFKALERDTVLCLKDPAFVALFNQICDNKEIVEHYLLDDLGSFLLVDYKGEHTLLALSNDDELATLYEIALDDGSPEEISLPLSKRQQLIFFPTDKDRCKQALEWQPYMHPAKPILGKDNYYYALVSDDSSVVSQSELTSYKHFLEGQQ